MCVCVKIYVCGGSCRCLGRGGVRINRLSRQSTSIVQDNMTPLQVFPAATPRPHSPELLQVEECVCVYVCVLCCICVWRKEGAEGGCYYAPQGHYQPHRRGTCPRRPSPMTSNALSTTVLKEGHDTFPPVRQWNTHLTSLGREIPQHTIQTKHDELKTNVRQVRLSN